MSKERARRRAERLAAQEAQRRKRARREARRQALRTVLRRLVPRVRRGRTGRLRSHRTPAQRAAVAMPLIVAAGAIWYLVDDAALRIILAALLLLSVPVLLVTTLGRRT